MIFPPSLRIVLALGASLFTVSASAASPENDLLQVTTPIIPPPDIPEEPLPGFRLARLTFEREFDSPVMLVTIPEGKGEQVVAMQRGEFCAVRVEDATWRPFLDFRERMKDILLFEEGVHGIAFHPQFATNRLFYLSYTQNEPRRTVISEMKATAGDAPAAMP
jgi:quinoprotein glucose dehydrogenase